MKTLIFILALASFSASATADSVTLFKGRPLINISEGGIERIVTDVPKDQAPNFACIISQISGKYYWASRENVELVAVQGGAFTTFTATNGSGYVRVLDPQMKQAATLMGGPESNYYYVEHLLVGLRSVTYYGVQSK